MLLLQPGGVQDPGQQVPTYVSACLANPPAMEQATAPSFVQKVDATTGTPRHPWSPSGPGDAQQPDSWNAPHGIVLRTD